jgi:anaerobic selenocysteine-containing dehydrogenase
VKTGSAKQTVRSTCDLCGVGCGVLIELENGEPVKVKGDPTNPVNSGWICLNGKSSLEYLNHPDRVRYPLKRIGEKGEGKWERISWDEALEAVSAGLTAAREKYGAESVAFMQGHALGYPDGYLARFANVFGSPNTASMSYICFHARLRAMLNTYGFLSQPDFEGRPASILIWGSNLEATEFPSFKKIKSAKKSGSRLIVIDPAETELARIADLWIKPRPCTDLALALGMINVIIKEGLYDKDFVEKWTTGFDKLASHVKDYSPEKVQEITWVDSKTIREAARMYAQNRPAAMHCGNGLDNNINNFQSHRAASILRAITGNLGRRGGEVLFVPAPVLSGNGPEMHIYTAISPEVRSRRIGADLGVLPNYYSALPQKLFEAMRTSKPYPVKAALIQAGGFLHSHSHVEEVAASLKSLDFLAVIEFFRTPTAELADIILPAGTFLEIDGLGGSMVLPVTTIIQKVAQVGECRSNYEILNGLAKKLGLGKYFWNSEKEVLDAIMKPAGLTFDEFRNTGILHGKIIYDMYSQNGFHTPSGKVELYSDQLEKWGFDPLPVYHEIPESELVKPGTTSEYPLVFTSSKVPGFIHSAGRQNTTLRKHHPDPIVTINKGTAGKLNIAEGDWVFIENRRGRIKQKARLSANINPRVIIAEHGWWYPESDENMHRWSDSNVNILTKNDPPFARELGSVTLRGLACKVYKAGK